MAMSRKNFVFMATTDTLCCRIVGGKRKPDRAQPQEKFGEMFRRQDFAELTTPSAPLWNGTIFLMAWPPLLCKEGNNKE